jgi:hypothetical protein
LVAESKDHVTVLEDIFFLALWVFMVHFGYISVCKRSKAHVLKEVDEPEIKLEESNLLDYEFKSAKG